MKRMMMRDRPSGVRSDLSMSNDELYGPKQNFVRFVQPAGQIKALGRWGGDQIYSRDRQHPMTPEFECHKVRLAKQFEAREYRDAVWEYEYDFSDSWVHRIEIVGRGDAKDGWKCVDGIRHDCTEDIGGWKGWEEMKKAYRANRPDEEQKAKMEWFETMASNGDPKGLRGERVRFVDLEEINRTLHELNARGVLET